MTNDSASCGKHKSDRLGALFGATVGEGLFVTRRDDHRGFRPAGLLGPSSQASADDDAKAELFWAGWHAARGWLDPEKDTLRYRSIKPERGEIVPNRGVLPSNVINDQRMTLAGTNCCSREFRSTFHRKLPAALCELSPNPSVDPGAICQFPTWKSSD